MFYFTCKKNCRSAKNLFLKTYNIFKNLKRIDLNLARCSKMLMISYCDLNLNKAEKYCMKGNEFYQSLLGDNHPETHEHQNYLRDYYRDKATEEIGKNNDNEAEKYFLKAWGIQLKFKLRIDSSVSCFALFNNMAYFYKNKKKDLKKAEETYLEGIKIMEKSGESVYLAVLYSNIAQMYNESNSYDKAEVFFMKACKIAEKCGNTNDEMISKIYGTTATFYEKKNMNDKAEIYYERCFHGLGYQNAAIFYEQIRNNLEKAALFYKKAINYYIAKGDPSDQNRIGILKNKLEEIKRKNH